MWKPIHTEFVHRLSKGVGRDEVHEAAKSMRTLWSNEDVQVRANNDDYGAAKGRAMPRWHSLNMRAISSSLSRRRVCHMSWFEEADEETS